MASASGKGALWELLTRQGVRGPGAGHRGAAPKHVGTRTSCSVPDAGVNVPQLCCCWDCAPLSRTELPWSYIPQSLQTDWPSKS